MTLQTTPNSYQTQNYISTLPNSNIWIYRNCVLICHGSGFTLSHKSLLAQFQTGILSLRIETGRYQLKKDPNAECFRKLKVEERTCLICNTGDIENEKNFLCKCCAYKIPWVNLYRMIEINFPNLNKKCLMKINLKLF